MLASPVENMTLRWLQANDTLWMIAVNRNPEPRIPDLHVPKGLPVIKFGNTNLKYPIQLRPNSTLVLEWNQ
ncbi:MAG: hypothetical protein U5R06_09295 [candidate division KSB1 bacterium]|nr:hypothetical protein [candidate division KSB1 bacterium]